MGRVKNSLRHGVRPRASRMLGVKLWLCSQMLLRRRNMVIFFCEGARQATAWHILDSEVLSEIERAPGPLTITNH